MVFTNIKSNITLSFLPLISAWKGQHLLKGFISREIKGRFAGSFGGILWTLINPLATIAVYMFLFSIVVKIPITSEETGTNSFLIYFLSGLFPWLMFSESLTRSVGCLLSNANLITKVVFPVELLPTSSLLTGLIINGIGMALFLLYLLTVGYIDVSWMWIMVLLPLQLLFTWGLVMFVSALSVFIRDLQELIGIILMIWFYSTPILYPLSLIPAEIRSLVSFNPIGILVALYRDILLKQQINLEKLIIFFIISFFVYMIGSWFFMKSKPALADVL